WSGGIAGSSSNSIIRRSYAYGSVSANTGNRGSLLGWDVGGNTVAAVFVHSQANEPYVAPTPSSPELNLLVTELTTEQFKQSGHFVSAGWDFENVWQMGAKGPVHRSTYCTDHEQIN